MTNNYWRTDWRTKCGEEAFDPSRFLYVIVDYDEPHEDPIADPFDDDPDCPPGPITRACVRLRIDQRANGHCLQLVFGYAIVFDNNPNVILDWKCDGDSELLLFLPKARGLATAIQQLADEWAAKTGEQAPVPSQDDP